jgi:hypothetical protein
MFESPRKTFFDFLFVHLGLVEELDSPSIAGEDVLAASFPFVDVHVLEMLLMLAVIHLHRCLLVVGVDEIWVLPFDEELTVPDELVREIQLCDNLLELCLKGRSLIMKDTLTDNINRTALNIPELLC